MDRRRGQVLPESMALLVGVTLLGLVGMGRLGAGMGDALADDAQGRTPSGAMSSGAMSSGTMATSQQAALWTPLEARAATWAAKAAEVPAPAFLRGVVVEGLGVAGSRPRAVSSFGEKFVLAERLPARGSDEWRAFVATVRAGLAPDTGPGYAVLPTAERLPAYLGEGLRARYPAGGSWGIESTGKLRYNDWRAFRNYRLWVTDLLNEANVGGLPFRNTPTPTDLRIVNGSAPGTRLAKPHYTDRWHTDGKPVRVALTLEGDATEFLPVTRGVPTQTWEPRDSRLSPENEARLRAHGFLPVRARRGDIVFFRGSARGEPFAHIDWEPLIHRGPASDDPRVMAILGYSAAP